MENINTADINEQTNLGAIQGKKIAEGSIHSK